MRGKAAARRPNATPRHVSDLVPDPENRRKHNARNLGMVVDALQHVGAARSIVIDEDNVILAGNGVTEAAGQAGITKVRVVEAKGDEIIAVRRSGLTAEQKRALAIYDNRAGELAEWNPEQLRADVDAGLDLHPWFSTAELASVLPKDVKAGRTDPDEVPAERPTDIAVGDMFELGRHRVICGDSTIHETVERVVGDHADIAFTSPPYGAGNVAKIRDHYVAGAKHRRSFYAEHKDDPSGWLSLMNGWFRSVRPRVDAVLCNIQQLADNKRSMIEWVYENRDDFCDVVVWDKGNAAPQMQKNVLSNEFEFIHVFGGNSTRSIPFGQFHGTLSNVVRINPRGKNEFAGEHRAVFPVELPLWVFGTLCSAAATVVDPFLGTGTTMIAAEQLGRSCYGVELTPSYVQISIDRWELFTGQKAKKVGEAVRA